jgi:dolichol-phosphate mannosyltransferase
MGLVRWATLMISVVIPTYNEAAVIEETLRRAAASLRRPGQDFELIVVDDSSADGTAEIAESLSKDLPVRVLRRPGRLGLATAVIDGWNIARGDVLGVMDADLQHPPEVLSSLADALCDPDVDIAVASRYIAGGGTSQWSWLRRFMSKGATHLAACVLPLTLADVTDPMSGMFFVRASAISQVQLNPLGYKILLEVLAKARRRAYVEVPYLFEQRGRGSSKLGARQYLEFFFHLARLAASTGQLAAWVRYGLVGLSGAAINLGGLYLLVEHGGWPLVLALPVAIQLALLSNFFWNETLTFRSSRPRPAADSKPATRFLAYEIVCIPGAILNALVTLVLYTRGTHLLLAAAGGVVAGGLLNLLFNIPAIWRIWRSRMSPQSARGN